MPGDGAAVVVVVDAGLRAHLARALAEHRRWLRVNRVAVPAGFDALLEAVASAASGGPGGPVVGPPAGPVDAGPVLLDYETAGRRLSLSARTVRRLVAEGRLRAVRVGRAVRIPASAIEEFA